MKPSGKTNLQDCFMPTKIAYSFCSSSSNHEIVAEHQIMNCRHSSIETIKTSLRLKGVKAYFSSTNKFCSFAPQDSKLVNDSNASNCCNCVASTSLIKVSLIDKVYFPLTCIEIRAVETRSSDDAHSTN